MRIGLVHLFPARVNNETNVDRTNEWNDLTKSLSLRFQTVTIMCSLRSKRFRLVSEQRKTEEGDFWFLPREK